MREKQALPSKIFGFAYPCLFLAIGSIGTASAARYTVTLSFHERTVLLGRDVRPLLNFA